MCRRNGNIHEVSKRGHQPQSEYCSNGGEDKKYLTYSGVKVSKSIPPWKAAFIEPLACSIHAVELGSIGLRDTVVVAGCGPLGQGMVAAARLKNPALLIALDLYDWKVTTF